MGPLANHCYSTRTVDLICHWQTGQIVGMLAVNKSNVAWVRYTVAYIDSDLYYACYHSPSVFTKQK